MRLICIVFLCSQVMLNAQTAQEWFEKGKNTEDSNQKIAFYTKAIEQGYTPLADAYTQRGRAKNRLNQCTIAILDFNKALEMDPKAIDAYLGRSYAYGILKQGQASMADLNKIIELNPNEARAYHNRGMVKKDSGQYQAAILDFDKAVTLKNPVTYYERGLAKQNLRQSEGAIIDLDEAILLGYKPLGFAYNIRGNAKNDLGEYLSALSDYDKSIELEPKNEHAYHNRGICKKNLKQYQSAIADFDKAILLKNPTTYYERGLAKQNLRQSEGAIADLDQAILLGYKPIAFAYNIRGNAKSDLGSYQSALLDYDNSIALEPRNEDAYHNRGNCKQSLKQYQAAIVDFDRAIQLKPNYATAFLGRGIAKVGLMRFEEAILDYDKAITLGFPALSSGYNNRGIAKLALKRYQAALLDFNKSLEIDPSNVGVYNNRANAKKGLGQYPTAMLDYDKMIELQPNGYEGFTNRAILKMWLLQYQAAILDYNKAIELNPKEALLYNYRGKTYLDMGDYVKAIADYDKSVAIGGITYKPDYPYRATAEAKLNSNDNTPPIISLIEPRLDKQGFGIKPSKASFISVQGRASGLHGIREVLINGQQVQVSSDGLFATRLNIGIDKVMVQVTDKKGSKTEKTIVMNPVEPPKPTLNVSEKRLAFVVSNANYNHIGGLGECPHNDAEDMAAALKRLGFDVMIYKDANLTLLKRKIIEFSEQLKDYDLGLFFYAGHGLGIEHVNYLVPTDFSGNATKSDVPNQAIAIDWVQNEMAKTGTEGKTNIVIIDACRDEGNLRNIRGTQSAWEVPKNTPSGFITCYAVPHGASATNCNGRNGYYTLLLLKHLETPGLLLQQIFSRVRAEIVKQKGKIPTESTQITQDIYLKQI